LKSYLLQAQKKKNNSPYREGEKSNYFSYVAYA
jgi:hypothetical protein